MNAFGYLLHRLGARLGLCNERHRWTAINRETQILSEAEDLLGRLAWPDVKDLDELSGEYWQIRDIDQQQETLRQQSRDADERNESLKEKLHAMEEEADHRFQSLRARKSKRMEEALVLMHDIEEIKGWKEETKKKFLNLQSKIELMQRLGQADDEISGEVEKTESAMARLKEEFSGDLTDIKAKTDQIEAVEREVASLDQELTDGKARLKQDTLEITAEIGRLSKQIADLSAKIGALENTKSGFYFTVGHFLSNHIDTRDPAIFRVLRKHRQLVSRILYYRRSIAYNQQLTRVTKRR
jgi:chromosome segregation ATPase